MTDYSKLKVTELKEELKIRNIPLTGLKVKQNFIDKLLESDAADIESNSATQTGAASDEAVALTNVAAQDGGREIVETDEAQMRAEDDSTIDQPSQEKAKEVLIAPGQLVSGQDDESKVHNVGDEESQTLFTTQPVDTTTKPVSEPLSMEDGPTKLFSQPVTNSPTTVEQPSAQTSKQPSSQPSPDLAGTPQPPLAPSSTPSSGRVPSAELLEDSRKRKRRSVTPPPSASEITQKKSKAADGSPRAIQTKRSVGAEGSHPQEESRAPINHHDTQERATQEPPLPAEGDNSGPLGEPNESEQTVKQTSPTHFTPQRSTSQRADDPLQSKSPVRSKLRSPNLLKRRSLSPPKPAVDDDRHVSPALHPATSSLYIRNFKRPLHIPSLRSHISTLAASPGTGSKDDPIASFYLDSVRTHAFISFISTSAASRARSALHETRFPDEKTREPLWADFIPDEKVEEWIEKEQKANAGGRIGRRWEVVYHDSPNGLEAILQETGSGSRAAAATQRRSSFSTGTRESEMAVATPNVQGVHPDRAKLVPSEDDVPLRKDSSLSHEQRPEQTGKGFKALDDLFPSTTAKPKLYYKPVDVVIAEERMDMIRDLRNLGGAKSGDPDMRRYSFEVDRGREEWVDKGPEFGYGARGRAAERGGRGGYRGRGGGGRGSDSWRSGGRY